MSDFLNWTVVIQSPNGEVKNMTVRRLLDHSKEQDEAFIRAKLIDFCTKYVARYKESITIPTDMLGVQFLTSLIYEWELFRNK